MNGKPKGSTHILIATKEVAGGRRLRAVLKSEPGFHVLGQTSEALGVPTLTRELKPDILLLDSALACDLNGGANSLSAVRVILIVPAVDRARVLIALRLAAWGILPKNSPPQALVTSIRKVMRGRYSVDTDGVAVLVQVLRECVLQETAESSRQDHDLTPRERDLVGLVAAGNSNKQIAQMLFNSERTVKHRLTAVFNKLRVSSRLELAVYATAHGLTSARISRTVARLPDSGGLLQAEYPAAGENHVLQNLRHT